MKTRWVITVVGRALTTKDISAVSQIATTFHLNIESMDTLSRRIDHDTGNLSRACIQLMARGSLENETHLRSKFLQLSQETGIDISFQLHDLHYRSRKLGVFDMDSTLIQMEVIDELAKRANVGEQVAEITKAAMRGELDFKQSLIKRLSLLKGLDASVLEDIGDHLPLTEGVERLIKVLKKMGFKLGILSGGFSFFADILKKKLGFDYSYANQLEIIDGRLTGNVIGEIVDGKRKAELFQWIAEKEGISLEHAIAIGDGANDLPMIGIAGLGVAFHAKPIVVQKAKHSISSVGLDGLLYLIGIKDEDVED